MVFGEFLVSVECLAALFTLLYVGKLVLESPMLTLNSSEGPGLIQFSRLSIFGGSRVTKRSLLNQHVVRKAV